MKYNSVLLLLMFLCFSSYSFGQQKLIDSVHYLVGETISIDAMPEKDTWLNCFYKGKYKVIESLKGNFSKGDTIEVVIFDHEDCPPLFTEFPFAFIGFRIHDNGENWILRGENCTPVFKSIDKNWVTGAFGFPKWIKHWKDPYPVFLEKPFFYTIGQLMRFNPNAFRQPDDPLAIAAYRNYRIDRNENQVEILRGYTAKDRYEILIRNFE